MYNISVMCSIGLPISYLSRSKQDREGKDEESTCLRLRGGDCQREGEKKMELAELKTLRCCPFFLATETTSGQSTGEPMASQLRTVRSVGKSTGSMED